MTTRQQQQPHGADESAGVQETIYSSDGLPSIVLPLPPPPLPPIGGISGQDDNNTNHANEDDGRSAVLENQSTDPRAAFNVFFNNNIDFLSTGPNSLYNRTRPTNDVPSSLTLGWEDPRRRLFRLRAEIESLEHAFAAATTEKDEDEATAADDAVTASELKSRIDALLPGEDFVSMLRGRQEALSSVIARDMDRLSDIHDNVGVKEGGEDTVLTQGGGDNNNDGVGKIVYELYKECGGGGSKNIKAVAASEMVLEERVRKLELAVGAAYPSSTLTGSRSSSRGGG